MHNHHETIGALTQELNSKLIGFSLEVCFSRSKEELYFEFSDGKISFGWSLIFHNRGLFFGAGCHRFRNGKDIKHYKEDYGSKIIHFESIPGERCMILKLSTETEFIFKCYGVHANLIRMQANQINQIYRTHLKSDLHFVIPQPTVGPIASHKTHDGYRFWKKNPGWEIYKNAQLFEEGHSYIEGLDRFTGLYLKDITTSEEKQRHLKYIQGEKLREEKKRNEVLQQIKELNQNDTWEQQANLIMAHLHLLESGAEVSVSNFYTGKPISLKIPGQKTPQQHASDLYRKQKNQKIAIEFLTSKSESLSKRIAGYQAQLTLIESGIIPNNQTQAKQKNEHRIADRFRKFEFEGWEIYAGKNAHNNELLTFEFATKNDIWLHAAEVSGSHVIIRNIPGQKVPEQVMQYAASVAISMSKNKHTSLGRVVYCLRKHISRVKKGNPGEVHVMKPSYLDVAPNADIK